jgi:hypothetical protein
MDDTSVKEILFQFAEGHEANYQASKLRTPRQKALDQRRLDLDQLFKQVCHLAAVILESSSNAPCSPVGTNPS